MTPSGASIHRLASARLVVITRQPAGPDTAELAHEALLDAWPRLADWVNANREFRTWQEGLRRARRRMRSQVQGRPFLLDEPGIAEAREWERRREEDLTSAERDFIATSVDRGEPVADAGAAPSSAPARWPSSRP